MPMLRQAIQRRLLALVLVLVPAVMLALAAPAEAREVQVGVYILNLGKLDVATGAFTADFYLSLKCAEPFTEDPTFEFMNGRAASIEKIDDKPNEKFYRIMANLSTPIDLKKFPFDTQKMQIIIEDKLAKVEDMHYVPLKQESGIDPAIVFPGWLITGNDAAVAEHNYAVYGEKYSQYVFTVDISRIMLNSFMKTFLPVLFIMLIVMGSFVLHADQIITRLAAISSALIASVMFHVSISNQIPPVGYLTFADKFMMTTYMVLLLTYTLSIAMFRLQAKSDAARAQRLHALSEKIAFIGTPVVYAALFLFLR